MKSDSDGKKAGSWIIAVVVAVGAFALVKTGKQRWAEHEGMQKAAQAAEQNFQNMQAQAAQQHPSLTASEGLQQAAKTQMAAELAKHAEDRKKQASTAADQFTGFLLVNTRARVDYCRELGVDISSFKIAFEAAHHQEILRAQAIHAEEGWDPSRIYEPLKSQMRKTIEMDMNDIAKAAGGDSIVACKLVGDHAKELATEMHLSKMQPAVYKALMGR